MAIVDRGRLIALGSPATLIASLGAGHVIEFALEPGSPMPSDGSLSALPGVRDVRHEGEATLLIADAPRLTVPALLAGLDRASATLARLTTHSATLEDVFVALTGRHLRDD